MIANAQLQKSKANISFKKNVISNTGVIMLVLVQVWYTYGVAIRGVQGVVGKRNDLFKEGTEVFWLLGQGVSRDV